LIILEQKNAEHTKITKPGGVKKKEYPELQ
jgi:hypothetical protein